MKDLKLSITIDRPAKDIFAFALNPQNTPKWIDFISEEETNEWPPKLDTIYRNRGDNEAVWSEFEVTEYEQDKLFMLSKIDGNYHVRYTLNPITPTTTELTYYEWTDSGELEVPFTMEPLEKLKELLEEGSTSHLGSIDPRLAEINNALYRISAKAIIVHGNKVLLVREKDDDWWSFHGGGVDYGETIHEALVREVGEELGVPSERVVVDDTVSFIALGAIVDGVPKANLFYRVTVPADEIKPTEDVLEQKWFRIEELLDLYMSPATGNVIEQLKDIL